MVAVVSRTAMRAEETHDSWVAVFVAVTAPGASVRTAPCPNCGHFDVHYQYVADTSSRVGFCALWCDNCRHGHVLSRTRVPDWLDFLPLDTPEDALRAAIPEFEDPTMTPGSLGQDAAQSRLSPREAQVFELIEQGVPVREIAERLDVSRSTVYSVRTRIAVKLERSPTQLVTS